MRQVPDRSSSTQLLDMSIMLAFSLRRRFKILRIQITPFNSRDVQEFTNLTKQKKNKYM